MADKTLKTAREEIVQTFSDLRWPASGTTAVEVLDHVPVTGPPVFVCVDLAGLTWDAEYWRIPVRLYVRPDPLPPDESQYVFAACIDVVEIGVDEASLGADGRAFYDTNVQAWVAEWVMEILR